jgi:hypothetical protein
VTTVTQCHDADLGQHVDVNHVAGPSGLSTGEPVGGKRML